MSATEPFVAEIESVRNLRPRAFALATDPSAEVKARWTAFDELYDAIVDSLAGRGKTLKDLLPISPESGPEEVERACRVNVAMALTMARHNWEQEALNEAFFQAETLVPTPPDPDTGLPAMTPQDQAILNATTSQMRTEMPEDWACFYRGESEPVDKRRIAFARLYTVVGKVWLEYSLYARRLTSDQRQKLVILAFMSHVSHDQWTREDLEKLWTDLVMARDPDWSLLDGPTSL